MLCWTATFLVHFLLRYLYVDFQVNVICRYCPCGASSSSLPYACSCANVLPWLNAASVVHVHVLFGHDTWGFDEIVYIAAVVMEVACLSLHDLSNPPSHHRGFLSLLLYVDRGHCRVGSSPERPAAARADCNEYCRRVISSATARGRHFPAMDFHCLVDFTSTGAACRFLLSCAG